MKAAHMNPEEAVKAFDDLEAKYGIAIHWETFKLTTEPKQELPECRLKGLNDQQNSSKKFRIFRHGKNRDTPFSEKI